MKTIEIDCWEVTEADGDGIRSNHVAFFSDELVAKKFVSSKKDRWLETPRRFRKTFVIMDSLDDLEQVKKTAAIAAAKAKLTKEELELLGIE